MVTIEWSTVRIGRTSTPGAGAPLVSSLHRATSSLREKRVRGAAILGKMSSQASRNIMWFVYDIQLVK